MIRKCCLDRRPIGEILLERGAIRQEHLEAALQEQRRSPGNYIGEILIRLGHVTEIDIVTALVVQCNLPYIAIRRHHVCPELIALIPAELARRGRLVPLDKIGNALSVVMADPLNTAIREEVEKITGFRVATFVSTGSEINEAIRSFYGE